MSDLDEIKNVIVRYATGIDSRDWDLFRTCFTDDCQFDYGPLGQWDSAEFVTQYMKLSHSGPSLHRLTNFVISIEGDSANARTYVDAVVYGPVNWICANSIGIYEDEFVRTAEGWKIKLRCYVGVSIKFRGVLSIIPSNLAAAMSVAGSKKLGAAATREITHSKTKV